MKAKTIKMILKRKVDAWIGTIEDPDIQKLAQESTIITGGCIPSMLMNEPVSDFDIYFSNREAALKIATYYVKRFNDLNKEKLEKDSKTKDFRAWVDADKQDHNRIRVFIQSVGMVAEPSDDVEIPEYQYFEQNDPAAADAEEYVEQVMMVAKGAKADERGQYRPIFLSSNAITLSDKIQLVIRFHGSPEKIHENYDFIHCTGYWTSWDRHLELPQEALECLLTKELRYKGSKYPLCSVIRTRKFTRKGWTINAGQYLKMAMQISEMDLTNYDVLEDQLTGVDIAYFQEILENIKDKKDITTTYIIELVDKLF
jgi:hypothetical protein